MGIFIDSGAFSVFTGKADINIDSYIKFIKQINKYKMIDAVAALDVIGSDEESQKNYKYMKKKGVNVVPTFHIGDDFKSLKKMMNEYSYIAIGGIAKASSNIRKNFLDDCWEILTDKEGNAIIKVHGFGITAPEFMIRYPWYSTDSTSWLSGGQYGRIYVPKWNFKTNSFDFIDFFQLNISRNNIDSTNYQNLNKDLRHYTDKFIISCGYEIEEFRNKYMVDMPYKVATILYLYFYKGLEEQLNCYPPVFKRRNKIDKLF